MKMQKYEGKIVKYSNISKMKLIYLIWMKRILDSIIL